MNHHRRFWDELLVALEESFAAFSGVNPDLIEAPTTIPKTCRRDGGMFGSPAKTSAICPRLRMETRLKTMNRER
jgi:hypothetical protein